MEQYKPDSRTRAADEEVPMSAADMKAATQYLTYTLGSEVFALDIAKVREVLDYPMVTLVPNMPDFLLGVINLRGTVVPVADLRCKFRMEQNERTVNTCVIITEVNVDGDVTIVGVLADSVQEVMDLEPRQIEPAPKIGTQLKTDFIKGMGKRDDRFIIILDIDRVFSADELANVHTLSKEASSPPPVCATA